MVITNTANTIDALRQGVDRIEDTNLKDELMNKVAELQSNIADTHSHVHAQRGEIETLQAELHARCDRPTTPRRYVYDPPV